MSRANVPQTDAEIAANFRACLADATKTGTPPPTEQGFDLEVIRALCAVARAFPEIDPQLAENAKLELQRQLDGTHIAAHRAQVQAWLAELD